MKLFKNNGALDKMPFLPYSAVLMVCTLALGKKWPDLFIAFYFLIPFVSKQVSKQLPPP